MRTIIILCLAFCWQVASAQSSRSYYKYANKTLNIVDFSQKNDSLDNKEIRRIPEDIGIEFPFYVSLGSDNHKFIHYEFFRLDTPHYFVREYFKNDFLSGEKVKSFGEAMVDKKAFDTRLGDLIDVCSDKIPSYVAAFHHIKKEGKWTEFEKGPSDSIFWRGNYLNDNKTGVWKRMLSFDVDTVLLGEINYGKNSTKNISGNNGIREKSLADLKEFLVGKWSSSSFWHEPGIIRSFKNASNDYYTKVACYLDVWLYQFNKSGEFSKQLPDLYDNGEVLNRGTWQLHRNGDQTFIDLIYNDGTKWEMELLYYSWKEGLFMNLNKHPRSTK